MGRALMDALMALDAKFDARTRDEEPLDLLLGDDDVDRLLSFTIIGRGEERLGMDEVC